MSANARHGGGHNFRHRRSVQYKIDVYDLGSPDIYEMSMNEDNTANAAQHSMPEHSSTSYRLKQDQIPHSVEYITLSSSRFCRICVALGIFGTGGCEPWDICDNCHLQGHCGLHCPTFSCSSPAVVPPVHSFRLHPAYPDPFVQISWPAMTILPHHTASDRRESSVYRSPPVTRMIEENVTGEEKFTANNDGPADDNDGETWIGSTNDLIDAGDTQSTRPPMICFNCNEEGHGKAECPKERVVRPYLGTCLFCKTKGHHVDNCPTKPDDYEAPPQVCFVCKQEGHPARECPDKPAVLCYNCKQHGHEAAKCTLNRIFDEVPDIEPAQAWAKVIEADKEKDVRAFREAVRMYAKAVPDTTWVSLEQALREPKDAHKFTMHIIATAKELPITRTYFNLQGEQDKMYQINFCLSDKPKRARQNQGWPESAEENIERLKDAGIPMDRGVVQCLRCEQLGHTVKDCAQERAEDTTPKLPCVNCGEEGHRLRDCPKPRKVRGGGCRNCGEEGHKASECPNPPDLSRVECRNCGQSGHFAKDCEQPRNPATIVCRNCNETGHIAKECPQPKDWSKVICSNCNQAGHTIRRCKEPHAETAAGATETKDALASTSGGGWESTPAAPEDTLIPMDDTLTSNGWNDKASPSMIGW